MKHPSARSAWQAPSRVSALDPTPRLRRWALVALAALGIWATEPARAEYDPTQRLYVRRSINDLTTGSIDMIAYSNGIVKMKSLATNNTSSWWYQANIHGTYATSNLTSWNSCQHQSAYFVAWHRMYLYYFERIVRKQSGNTNFAIPYWDYEQPTQRALPSMFRSPATAANPFYVAARSAAINRGSNMSPAVVSASRAMTAIPFYGSYTQTDPFCFGGVQIPTPSQFNNYSFSGTLEVQPHNNVHSTIGGWMGDPNRAANDPIFWLHHANIDRLWVKWIAAGGHTNPITNTNWMNTSFTFFDENSRAVVLTGKQVLDTAKQLNYTYGPSTRFIVAPLLAAVRPPLPLSGGSGAPAGGIKLIDGKTTTSLSLSDESQAHVLNVAAARRDAPERLSLQLDNISFDRPPDCVFEVYLNLPDALKSPNPDIPYFVDHLSFFGLGKHEKAPNGVASPKVLNASHTIDITHTVKRLKASGLWQAGPLKVTLVSGGVELAEGEIHPVGEGSNPIIGKITLIRH